MLTRNDKCFFALAFYRQSIQEITFALKQNNMIAAEHQAYLAKYWWDEFIARRVQSRLMREIT